MRLRGGYRRWYHKRCHVGCYTILDDQPNVCSLYGIRTGFRHRPWQDTPPSGQCVVRIRHAGTGTLQYCRHTEDTGNGASLLGCNNHGLHHGCCRRRDKRRAAQQCSGNIPQGDLRHGMRCRRNGLLADVHAPRPTNADRHRLFPNCLHHTLSRRQIPCITAFAEQRRWRRMNLSNKKKSDVITTSDFQNQTT